MGMFFSRYLVSVGFTLGAGLFELAASAQPALEVYGNLPNIRAMSISPDGKMIGYLDHDGEKEGFFSGY